MFLRNHGLVCVGETIEEAFYLTYYAVRACEVQVRLATGFQICRKVCMELWALKQNKEVHKLCVLQIVYIM